VVLEKIPSHLPPVCFPRNPRPFRLDRKYTAMDKYSLSIMLGINKTSHHAFSAATSLTPVMKAFRFISLT
jgi:hypothetical protein